MDLLPMVKDFWKILCCPLSFGFWGAALPWNCACSSVGIPSGNPCWISGLVRVIKVCGNRAGVRGWDVPEQLEWIQLEFLTALSLSRCVAQRDTCACSSFSHFYSALGIARGNPSSVPPGQSIWDFCIGKV